jgi:hypothetical protein
MQTNLAKPTGFELGLVQQELFHVSLLQGLSYAGFAVQFALTERKHPTSNSLLGCGFGAS